MVPNDFRPQGPHGVDIRSITGDEFDTGQFLMGPLQCFRVRDRGDHRGPFRLESLRDRRPIPVVPPEMSAILPSNLFIRDLLYA
jgi:hypothetical protein